MTENHFLNSIGMFVLGVLGLFVSLLIFILFTPYFIFLGIGGLFLLIIFLIIWILVYLCLVIGAIISYVFRPLQPEKPVRSRGKPRKKR